MPEWFARFAEAIETGSSEYAICESCDHVALPPRQICPTCGHTEWQSEPLPDRGTVLSFTEISVTIPRFEGQTPYTIVLAELVEGIRLSGQLRDGRVEDLAIGDTVALGAEGGDEAPATLTFHPVES